MAGEDLSKCEANYAQLTPLTFIQRTAAVHPHRASVIYGPRRFTWSQTFERCRRLASALCSCGISPGDTVAVIAPNIPAMYEAHFGVPMAGAVLNAINFRLDARTIAVLLAHSEAKVVLVDSEFLPILYNALWANTPAEATKPLVVHILDESYENVDEIRGGEFGTYLDYEKLLRKGDPNFPIHWPHDEWDAISINYTSGTTSAPKGVVYNHRGAYLNSLTITIDWGLPTGAIYLWTLPMFHCNGWCFTWAMAAQSGTNICLRKAVPKDIFRAISEHGVTHMSGAPTVLNMIANAEDHERAPLPRDVAILAGGAPPAAAILRKMESLGFSLGHGYGLTETYGPAIFCVWKDEWNALGEGERASLRSRQGVAQATISMQVVDPDTMVPVPEDGQTLGEVMLKGNTVMKGYLKAQQTTEDAFKGGWFHTGDLGVVHPDGYLQLKDRSKDIIISGGENISSIEVESILFKHPRVLEAAVVAVPHEFWGEIPCAVITLKESAEEVSEKGIIEWCRQNMPRYMVPRAVVFAELPKTVTGKVQKNLLRERVKKLATASDQRRSKL